MRPLPRSTSVECARAPGGDTLRATSPPTRSVPFHMEILISVAVFVVMMAILTAVPEPGKAVKTAATPKRIPQAA